MLESVSASGVDSLLSLHGGDHNGVVGLEGIHEVRLLGERRAWGANRLDALAEAVLGDCGDDLT